MALSLLPAVLVLLCRLDTHMVHHQLSQRWALLVTSSDRSRMQNNDQIMLRLLISAFCSADKQGAIFFAVGFASLQQPLHWEGFWTKLFRRQQNLIIGRLQSTCRFLREHTIRSHHLPTSDKSEFGYSQLYAN